MFKRILYLGYYIKNLDMPKFRKFVRFAGHEKQKNSLFLIVDAMLSSLRFNISLLEYFQFRFYRLKRDQRALWAGTGYMYEYQLVMNPRNKRQILDDKRRFYQAYRPFVLHAVASLEELRSDKGGLAKKLLGNATGKLVLKAADGKCGAQVAIETCASFTPDTLCAFMEKSGFDLAEEYIIQHPDIMALSPSAVNTVRIFTQLDERNAVEILGCRFRISIDSPVDNMAAGNIAAPIDEDTGIVSGPGVYSDITRTPEEVHPRTGIAITGFRIPFWRETLDMVRSAALAHPENRSIGWDIVITSHGPGLIEGNHDWCKLVWQLPVEKGLKPILEKHLLRYKLATIQA